MADEGPSTPKLIYRLLRFLRYLISKVASSFSVLLDLLAPRRPATAPQSYRQASPAGKGVVMLYQIRGKVISKKRKPVPGVRVEVWDIENAVDDYLSYAATSHDGSFLINLEEEMIRDLFPHRYPDLYFKVWCGDDLLASTEDSVVWNTKSRWPTKIVVRRTERPRCLDRHIFLKIERLGHYSPVMPSHHAVGQARWGLDCMRNKGHEDGRIPDSEIEAREVDAVVYREYLDSAYLVPKPDKLIVADINEPLYDHRVPGTVIYARPCQRLKIHVWNDDDVPHSLHAHGLRYGISSDGTWPFGTKASNLGGRSDAICPGDTWVYTFDITEEMYGAWPFHDYTHYSNVKIEQGLFGGIVVLGYCDRPPRPFRFRRGILAEVYDAVEKNEPRDFHPKEKRIDFDRASPPFIFNPQIHFKRLNEDSKTILAHRLDFVEEYVNAEVAKPTKHIPTDHVPVFFHKMVRGHSHEHEHEPEPPRPLRPLDVNLNLDLVLAQRRLLDLGLVRPDLNDLVIGPLVPDKEVEHIPSLCINGRSFVGNTPTIVGRAGQRIRWYVFNLDISSNGHNFHAHGMRWRFGGENIDTRSFGPGESFIVEATIPPVLLLNEEQARMQQPLYRPRTAKLFRLRGDFLFHCHEQDHLLKGMAGLVRSRQSVWLTQEMADAIRRQTGLPLDDDSNNCPEVKPESCVDEENVGRWEEVPGPTPPLTQVLLMHSVLLPNTQKVLYWGRTRADQSRIWDYSTPAGSYAEPARQPAAAAGGNVNVSNMWSAAHTLLDTPEGIVLVHGGLAGNSTFTFDPTTMEWTRVGDTVGNRFYATTLLLADGRAPTLFGNVETIEIYTHGANWGAPIPMPASMFHHQFYPWTYLLRDGRLFIAGPHVPSQRFDISAAAVEDFNSPHGNRSTGSENGSSVLLILRPPDYDQIVYRMGGDPPAVSQSAEEINLSVPSPAWADLPDLQNARAGQFTATLLPDGRVFIAGGIGTLGDPDGGPCEIFDPRNPGAGWVAGPTMRFVRTYHSSFILLQDGSILGGGAPPDADNPPDYTPHERFFPSYFDRVRPVITGAPADDQLRRQFHHQYAGSARHQRSSVTEAGCRNARVQPDAARD